MSRQCQFEVKHILTMNWRQLQFVDNNIQLNNKITIKQLWLIDIIINHYFNVVDVSLWLTVLLIIAWFIYVLQNACITLYRYSCLIIFQKEIFIILSSVSGWKKDISETILSVVLIVLGGQSVGNGPRTPLNGIILLAQDLAT